MREKSPEHKILIIAYDFPTIKGISSLRNFNLATQFKKYFKDVKVLTTTNRRILPKESFPFDESQIYESPTIDYRTFSSSNKTSGVTTMPKESEDNLVKVKDSMVKIKDSFPFNMLIGQGGLLYIFCGVLISFYLIKKYKITHIFSSFKPYSCHAIAWWLKLFIPSLIWIADYNNLHYIPKENHLLWPKLQKWFDNFIASKADALSTVSDGLVEHLKKYNPNVLVLENGLMNSREFPNPQPYKKFTISYTGSVYPQQSSKILLKAIKELINENKIPKDDITLVYAGASSNLWNYYAKKQQVEFLSQDLGVLSLKDANQIQANSHLNLLLTWRTESLQGIIPAKFYDYLHARKNMLMIVRGGKDVVWEKKFKELNLDSLFYDTKENLPAIKSFLLGHYKNWKNEKPTSPDYPKKVFEGYYWDNLMKRFITELEALGLK